MRQPVRLKRLYGNIGLTCWILILPVKVMRHWHMPIDPIVTGVAPSLLGPAGLLLVILSNQGRFSELTIGQATLMAGFVALGLEFAQVLPGVSRLFRFDWLDVAATMVSLAVGASVGAVLRYKYGGSR